FRRNASTPPRIRRLLAGILEGRGDSPRADVGALVNELVVELARWNLPRRWLPPAVTRSIVSVAVILLLVAGAFVGWVQLSPRARTSRDAVPRVSRGFVEGDGGIALPPDRGQPATTALTTPLLPPASPEAAPPGASDRKRSRIALWSGS